jgi:hypothetical protein
MTNSRLLIGEIGMRYLAALALVAVLSSVQAASVAGGDPVAVSERELAPLFPGTFQVVVRGIMRIDCRCR